MALVISDSSVLIHLSRIGRLALLKDFFGAIQIPPAVWQEVVEDGKGRAGASEVEKARHDKWIQISSPKNESLVRLLERNLDAGEAEAIALALENNATMLLVDESDARQVAKLYNVQMTGTIGLLIRSHHEGKIKSFQTELDRLVDAGGFHISQELYEKALKAIHPKPY